MRRLIVQEWVSLDGYTSDKDGKLDFFTYAVRPTYEDGDQQKILQGIDCILFGRKTYEQFSKVWPGRPIENDLLATRMNREQKIVYSRSIKNAPWGEWKEAAIENGDPVSHVRKLKSSTGKDIVVWGSISLAQLLMENDLVDEIHLLVCPVVLGGGMKLFGQAEKSKRLNLLELKSYEGGNVFLRYTNSDSSDHPR